MYYLSNNLLFTICFDHKIVKLRLYHLPTTKWCFQRVHYTVAIYFQECTTNTLVALHRIYSYLNLTFVSQKKMNVLQ